MSTASDARRGSKIVIERSYRAQSEEVWDLQGFRADVHVLATHAGGELRYDLVADRGGVPW